MWEEALDKITEVALWKEYISFRLSSFSNFSVTAMREVFTSAIQALRCQSVSGESRTSCPNPLLIGLFIDPGIKEEAMLSFFLQAASFEKKAGYTEKSVALFQALLEFNCFCPPQLTTHTAQVKKFELFWDSEAPRLGERVG